MSRTVILIAALAVSSAAQAESPTMARYREMTTVVVRCDKPQNTREILVCGARRADRWRVPYVEYDAGDRRIEMVGAERARLIKSTRPPCGQGAIIADCGDMVGVKVNTAFDGSGLGMVRVRPLAP